MTSTNLKDFAKCVLQSKLVDRESLDRFARACQQQGGPLTAKTLAMFLVSEKALTSYQAKRLLQGRTEGFFLGGCRILDRVGEGGMGVVYLAQQERLYRKVALKVLPAGHTANADGLKRFYREARAAAKLKHANIVQVFDVDQQGDTHFIVMELINGKNLAELMKQNGPFPVGQSLSLMRQAAEGLRHAHANGVIHRDIKPANLVLEDSTVKILDLGLARHEADEKLTGDQTIMGTLDYMSPEQCQDTAGVDHRSDLYSLGCTWFHLLTGKPPFADRPQTGKLLSHVTEPLPDVHLRNALIPESVNQILQRMTAKQRKDRYQSADELLADLDGLSNESNLQTIIASDATLNEGAFASDSGHQSSAVSHVAPSLSDEDAANSNTVIHTPPANAWNMALLVPVMAALVLAGVYMGIRLLKDQLSDVPTADITVADSMAQQSGGSPSGNSQSAGETLTNEMSEGLKSEPAVKPKESLTPAEVVSDHTAAPPTEQTALPADAAASKPAQPPEVAMTVNEDTSSTNAEAAKVPPTIPEASTPTRAAHETVLRSFTEDWQSELVDGDILTLISSDTYELTAQVQQTKDLTIQGTADKRAVISISVESDACWKISNCSLSLQHVDIYVDFPGVDGSCDVFALDTADITLNDVSVTIQDSGRRTWKDLSVIRVSGAREWDVLAKGDAPEPLAVHLQRVFVRGPGTLVRNSSSHSVLTMDDSILTGTGPLLHAFHTIPRTEKHQLMDVRVRNSTLVMQESLVSIDCRPFELRPVPMRVHAESSIIATQTPVLTSPALIHWLSPVQPSLIADAFGFIGGFNGYIGLGEMFVAGQANGVTSTVCQFPQDWQRQDLGQDDSGQISSAKRTSKRIVWQDQLPRDFSPTALAQNAGQWETCGAPVRAIKIPKRLRLSAD